MKEKQVDRRQTRTLKNDKNNFEAYDTSSSAKWTHFFTSQSVWTQTFAN